MNVYIKSIYRYILREIWDGNFSAGELLPKEVELAEKFSTNRTNAYRAMKVLEKWNLIVRTKRLGTIVSPDINIADVEYRIKDENELVYVLRSIDHLPMHWDDSTFIELEKELIAHNFSVEYIDVSNNITNKQYDKIKNQIEKSEASALVIFPGQNLQSSNFISYKWLLNFKMPIYFYYRSNNYQHIEDIASCIMLDHFGDGVNVGKILASKSEKNLIFLDANENFPSWSKSRYDGIIAGLNIFGKYQVDIEKFLSEKNDILKVIEKIKTTSNLVVIAVNNYHATKLIDVAKTYNLNYPKDYRLISFDYNPETSQYNITSLGTPKKLLGRLFAKLIYSKMFSEEFKGRTIIRLSSILINGKSF